jgi:hypothetical protein
MKESVHCGMKMTLHVSRAFYAVGDVREIEGRHARSNSLAKYFCIARCRSSRLRMMILHEDARRNDGCLRTREIFRSGFVRIASLRGRCAWEEKLIRLLVRRAAASVVIIRSVL